MAETQVANGNGKIIDKLRKVLALTTSPAEGEAQAAIATLQRLLIDHNLSMADLEVKGEKGRPEIKEGGHDLGKAAFKWKLNLAEVIADHFFCHPLVNHTQKTVAFIGRPENVESLQMLYKWIMEQIADIAREDRRRHLRDTGEHIDPLRWQVNFGLGAVHRIRERLAEIRRHQEEHAANITALVVGHRHETSDYLEEKYGYRADGRKTKREEEWAAQWAAKAVEDKALLESDPDEYYRRYPWRRPMTEKQLAQAAREEERRQRRRTGPAYRERKVDWTKEEQARSARVSGRSAADKVNLQPFITGSTDKGKMND